MQQSISAPTRNPGALAAPRAGGGGGWNKLARRFISPPSRLALSAGRASHLCDAVDVTLMRQDLTGHGRHLRPSTYSAASSPPTFRRLAGIDTRAKRALSQELSPALYRAIARQTSPADEIGWAPTVSTTALGLANLHQAAGLFDPGRVQLNLDRA